MTPKYAILSLTTLLANTERNIAMIYAVKKTSLEVKKAIENNRTILKGNEYNIYHFLVSKASNNGNDLVGAAECTYNIGTISAKLGICMETVRRNLKKLEKKGFILVQYRKNQYNNENSSNLFTICEMLTDDALELKKEYIKRFPTIKIGRDIVEVMVNEVKEELAKAKELVVTAIEETKETISTCTEKVRNVLELRKEKINLMKLREKFVQFGFDKNNIPEESVLKTILNNYYAKTNNRNGWLIIDFALMECESIGNYNLENLFRLLKIGLNTLKQHNK